MVNTQPNESGDATHGNYGAIRPTINIIEATENLERLEKRLEAFLAPFMSLLGIARGYEGLTVKLGVGVWKFKIPFSFNLKIEG